MKAGYTTTEFYVTLSSYILSIIALFHPMTTNTQPYVQAVALLASGVATVIYTHSRQSLKTVDAYVSVKSTVPTTLPQSPAPVVTPTLVIPNTVPSAGITATPLVTPVTPLIPLVTPVAPLTVGTTTAPMAITTRTTNTSTEVPAPQTT